jgi:hypothetical protein
MRAETQTHAEPKIKELGTPKLEIVTIQAARTASTLLRIPMEEKAAPGIEVLTGR